MRKITRLILGSFLTAIVASGQITKPVWKGTITTENGVKVVKNPTEPLYGAFAFDLQEDLKIGGDPNDAPSYFPKGGVLSVDSSDNFYVVDFGAVRVAMFDKTGKFVRTIGRKGQGPGEYSFPTRVLFDAEGNPHVWDGWNILVFGKDGSFKRIISPKPHFSQAILGPIGSIIGTPQLSFGPGQPIHTLVLLDPDGVLPRTIAEFHGEFSEGQKSLVLHWYSNQVALTSSVSDTFIYGFSDEYKIFRSDAEGRTTLIVTRDEKPQSISASEKDETRKNGLFVWWNAGANRGDAAVFPGHRPFFSVFLSDDKGRLYVVRAKSILEKNTPTNVDVFSKDGIYLYKMIWPAAPAAIKNGAFHELREDKETGEYTIVRSRIKNWARMKTGVD